MYENDSEPWDYYVDHNLNPYERAAELQAEQILNSDPIPDTIPDWMTD